MTVLQMPTMARDVGRLGEMFVGYRLEREGFETSFVDRCGVDYWIKPKDGPIIKLEVKSASDVSHAGDNNYSYSFQVKERKADFYAFVALDMERMFVLPQSDLKKYTTHRFARQAFSKVFEDASILRLANYRLDPPTLQCAA